MTRPVSALPLCVARRRGELRRRRSDRREEDRRCNVHQRHRHRIHRERRGAAVSLARRSDRDDAWRYAGCTPRVVDRRNAVVAQ